MKPYRVLAVEDDAIFVTNLERHLEEMGHELVAFTDNADEVEALILQHHPDIILMDISIHGSMDGVEVATFLREKDDTPIIFLTANNDLKIYEETNKLLYTQHMIKPFDRITLDSSIKSLMTYYESEQLHRAPQEVDAQAVAGEAGEWFIKQDAKRIKISFQEVFHIQADGNYCYLFTTQNRRYAQKISLKKMMAALPQQMFVQVHRAHLVQFEMIRTVDFRKSVVWVNEKTIPLGGLYRDALEARLKTLI